ncbi:MAG: WD_0702 family putative metalloprotease [Wolbachia sp.]
MLIRNLIRQATKVGNSENTTQYIEYLYQFEKFRNTLNLTLSLIKQNRLLFEVYREGLVDTEEGVCKTIQSSSANRYVIVLRRSNPYIIVHELSHMVENELNLKLEKEFLHKVYQDIEQNLKQANILVQRIIGQVIFKEIQAYQTAKSRASELFARYFELFAWAQEVYPKDKEYLISTQDLNRVFLATDQWKKSCLDQQIMDRIDKQIKDYSNKTAIQDVTKVKSNWTGKFSPGGKKISSIFGDDD